MSELVSLKVQRNLLKLYMQCWLAIEFHSLTSKDGTCNQ